MWCLMLEFDTTQNFLLVVYSLNYFIYLTSTKAPTICYKYLHLQALVDYEFSSNQYGPDESRTLTAQKKIADRENPSQSFQDLSR